MQLEDYTTGTVSVANGSTALTGVGTAWSVADLKEGDTFYKDGYAILIASVDSDTGITLADAWPGTALSGATYVIRYQPDNSRMQGTTRQLLDQLRQGLWLTPDATGVTADKSTYDDKPAGFRFLDVSVDPFKMYVKESDTSADWSSGADWVGPQGAAGADGTNGADGADGAPGSSDVVGTSATSLAIATGSKTFTIAETNRGWGVGARLRAASDADGANFMEGIVTAYSGTSLTVNVDLIGGSGTKADWTINLAGERGAAGTGDLSSINNLSDVASASTALTNLGGTRRIATLAAMRASAASQFSEGEYVIVEGRDAIGDDGGGVYRYSSADLSTTFVRQTIDIASGDINTSTNHITKTAHGLRTGQGVLVTGGDGLTADTVVYYVRGRLADDLTIHPTYADAVAGTNAVDLTGTTAFSIRVLGDPDQVAFVTLAGKALDGSEGGLLHSDVKKRNFWRVEWFPSSGPDDTDQINRAILAAGTGGVLQFPEDTLVISPRDNDGACLWVLSGQTWRGEGRDRSIVQLSSSVTDVTNVIPYVTGASNTTLIDMCFDGNRDNITPAVDLFSYFNFILGPDGGKHNRWRRLTIKNSWGRSLQTDYGSGTGVSTDARVDDVIVLNSGTKAISLTDTEGGSIKNCYAEVNPYTTADHPGATDAVDSSLFECTNSSDVTIKDNTGKHVGASVTGPGLRVTNGSSGVRVSGNSIDGASYFIFASNVQDVDFFGNTGRNLTGNAISVFNTDALGAHYLDTARVRIHGNTIIDPAGAFVLITANKTGESNLEVFIYDNDFVQESASPTYGIYNNGITSPATSGACDVYQWGNGFTGTIPNHLAGGSAVEIQPNPERGWQIIGQSSVAASITGTTTETTLATVTIPAFAMGKNGRLRVTATWSYTNSANNKIPRVRFGGSQSYAATLTTTAQTRIQIEIGNRNSASSQVVCVPGNGTGWGATTTTTATQTINTAAAANLTLTAALADTSETMTLESYVVEVFYAK